MSDLASGIRTRLIELANEIASQAIRDPGRDPRLPRAVHALHGIADTLAPPAPARSGRRPAGLAELIAPAGPTTPEPPAPDGLTQIRGIDQSLAAEIAKLGTTNAATLANWRAADVKRIAAALNLGRRISQENWIEQAALLAAKATATLPPAALAPAPVRPSLPEAAPGVETLAATNVEIGEAEVAIAPRSSAAAGTPPTPKHPEFTPPERQPVSVAAHPAADPGHWEDETGAACVTIVHATGDPARPSLRKPGSGSRPEMRSGPGHDNEGWTTVSGFSAPWREGLTQSFGRFLESLRRRGGQG